MAKEKTKSPRYSFKGWDLKQFLIGRKRLVFTLVGSIGAYVVTQNPALSAIVGAGTELIASLVEYYVSEQ